MRELPVCLGAVVAWAALAQAVPEPEAPQAAASSAAASAAAAAFAEGVRAFDAGKNEEAFRLWMPLARQGSPQAQFNIAFMYEKGLGVARSDVEAARWYLAAAERGDVTAQSKVASLYEAGVGVARDLDKAAFWYAQAAKGNAKDPQAARQAREHLAGLADHLEPEDVTSFDGGRFVLRRAASGECVIALQGMVTPSASYKFDDVVRKAKAQGCVRPLTLMLESPGGLVDAGLALGRGVHDEGMRTVARYACASSCANIFMGGSERILWGSRAAIGLHQPSLIRDLDKPEDKRCFTTNFDTPVVAMRRYIQFVLPQTSAQIMAVAMSTPCKSITWVTGQGAIDLGLATRIEAEGEDVFGPRAGRLAASGPASR